MVVLKSLLGAILGVIVGAVLWFVAFLVSLLFSHLIPEKIYYDGVQAAALLVPAAGMIIGIIVPIFLEVGKKKEQAKERQLQAKQETDALNAECTSLATLLATSKSTFFSLKQLVPAANAHLDKAEMEFKEGAFAPFWDEVEHATNRLAAYHQDVNTIDRNATEYTGRASRLSVLIPKFDMPKGELPDARPIAVRLSKIVRQAQKDFQFATIYEQRKTNQLLYAGFGTLASAIDRMQTSIVDALEDLSTSLNTTLDDLVSASNAQVDMLSTLTDHIESSAEAQREFESDLLHNIKRHSQPFS